MSSFANKSTDKAPSVITINNLDSKNIVITKLRCDNKTKKYSAIFLNSVGKCSFMFETSIMNVAFEAGYFGEKDTEKNIPEEQRNYAISFRPNNGKPDSPENADRLMEFLEDLKNMAIDFGIENSNQPIFKRKYEQTHRDIMIDSSFEYPFKPRNQADGTPYPLVVNVKIPKTKDTNLPDFLLVTDHNGKIEPVELISWDIVKSIAHSGARCRAMIQPVLSFINKKMFFTLRLKQLKVYTYDKVTIPKTYAFSDVPALTSNTTENTEVPNPHTDNNFVAESDNERTSDVEVDTDDQ